MEKRISVIRGYKIRGKTDIRKSADIKSVEKTDIRYPRIVKITIRNTSSHMRCDWWRVMSDEIRLVEGDVR